MTLKSPAARVVLFVTVLVLFIINVASSYSLGQNEKMYRNPLYRWRESIAITLSWMREKPLHGYLAYRSIRDYLEKNGLSYMPDVAAETERLVNDGPRLDRLLNDALHIPIDRSLPPVLLKGNEKGLAVFYFFAFKLFGVSIGSFVKFYYLLLFVSAIAFFFTFRRSISSLLLLMLFLIGHLYMARYYIHTLGLTAVHNSRFFPALSILPTLHLLLLTIQRVRPSPSVIITAAVQGLLLIFIVFCRVEASWQVFAVIVAPILMYGGNVFARIWPISAAGLASSRKEAAIGAWPSLMMCLAVIAYFAYIATALDARYRTETTTHLFWHPMLVGTISSNPKLYHLYNMGAREFSDQLGYNAVMSDLRARQAELKPSSAAWKIARRANGIIYIDPQRSMGVYDQLARHVFWEVVHDHPWLVVEAFLIGKPEAEFSMLSNTNLFSLRPHILMIFLALAVTLICALAGARFPKWPQTIRMTPIIVLVALSSVTPIFVAPSTLIVDTILYYILLFLIIFVSLPTLWAVDFARQRVAHSCESPSL